MQADDGGRRRYRCPATGFPVSDTVGETTISRWLRYTNSETMSTRTIDQSSLITGLGLAVALVAIIGTQVLGWEWGDGQLVPTVIGVGIVGVIAVLYLRDR